MQRSASDMNSLPTELIQHEVSRDRNWHILIELPDLLIWSFHQYCSVTLLHAHQRLRLSNQLCCGETGFWQFLSWPVIWHYFSSAYWRRNSERNIRSMRSSLRCGKWICARSKGPVISPPTPELSLQMICTTCLDSTRIRRWSGRRQCARSSEKQKNDRHYYISLQQIKWPKTSYHWGFRSFFFYSTVKLGRKNNRLPCKLIGYF